MKHMIFSVYDKKAEAFLQPFFSQTTGTAVRAIMGTLRDEEHIFAKFSEDYKLFALGEFDDEVGQLTEFESKRNLGELSGFYRTEEET